MIWWRNRARAAYISSERGRLSLKQAFTLFLHEATLASLPSLPRRSPFLFSSPISLSLSSPSRTLSRSLFHLCARPCDDHVADIVILRSSHPPFARWGPMTNLDPAWATTVFFLFLRLCVSSNVCEREPNGSQTVVARDISEGNVLRHSTSSAVVVISRRKVK